jgi:4-amino-4-deoxy-L-arabinose transferase-like glycosyltransferase
MQFRLHLQRGASVPVTPDAAEQPAMLWDWRALSAPLAAMAVLWTLIPALIHTAPPLDIAESALWGREWVVGTYKHPAMPAWVLEISRWFNGGHIGWPAYLFGQIFNLATLALTYLLARDLAGPRVGTAAVLALLGVEYFSWRSPEFNHTQAQMPFWIGAAWCAWRAVERGTIGWWLALGAFAAAGLYGKLSNAMLLLVIAGWILSTPRGRATLATPGPWAGAVVFALLSVPLARWLLASNFQALAYAEARGSEQSLLATLLFPANALMQAAPIALLLAAAGFFRGAPPVAREAATHHNADRFLWVIALGPPLLSIILALIARSGLRATWLAPAFPLLTILLISLWPQRLDDRVLGRLGRAGLALGIVLPLIYGLAIWRLGHWSSAPLLRVSWPQADISAQLGTAWTNATGKPLRIVAGRAWPAGLVALNHPDRPSILTEGDFALSPWVTPAGIARDGALVVWMESSSAGLAPAMMPLIAGRPVIEERIAAPRGKPGTLITVKYVIVPPQ